ARRRHHRPRPAGGAGRGPALLGAAAPAVTARRAPSSPLALAEDGDAGAVRLGAVDVDRVGADDPGGVDEALVAAPGGDLVRAQRAAALEALGVALAERDVAGGVLVEEGVVEEEPALRDGRGMRHQRHLAEAPCALVGVEHLIEHLLAAARLRLDDAP